MHEGEASGDRASRDGPARAGPVPGGEVERALAEALEHQTATAEILRTMACSQADVQPVFDTIGERAARLCDAQIAVVSQIVGERLELVAVFGTSEAATASIGRYFPMPLDAEATSARAVRARSVENIPDVFADASYAPKDAAKAAGWRAGAAVPMFRGGEVIGAIFVGRSSPGPLPQAKVDLLKTFADQAVIAIENVRQFREVQSRNRELAEALERQTATSEILGIISRSPTDARPVFDTMAAAALRLCGATSALVTRVEGDLVNLVASANLTEAGAAAMREAFPMPIGPGNASARAIHRGATVTIPDVLSDSEYEVREQAVRAGFRCAHAVPLMRDGRPIGTITVGKSQPGSFSASQASLLQTFADQAVIAIENVRLFNEIERRNREVSEALEHQTATAEILRVISRSPGDVQPVFEVIGERAARLCEARVSVVSRVAGDRIDAVAIGGVAPDAVAKVHAQFPMTRDTQSATARAVRKRAVEHIPDVFADPDYGTKEAAAAADWRGCAAVPMLRGDEVIGAIFVAREAAGLFPESKIELLKTFADQAVIAIENVRLFNETKEALDRELATGDVLKVISRSAFDLEPVLASVLESATRLCGAQHAHVMRYDGERLRLAASHGGDPGMMEHIREHPLALDRTSIAGVAALERRPVHWHDVLEVEGYSQLAAQRLGDFRTLLAVPMVKYGALLGVIVLWKTRVEPFTDKQIELVATFADQAVIAIENVRLFNETKEALERQTGTSNVLRAISRAGFDVDPVLNTVLESAARLCGAEHCHMHRYDGQLLRLAASYGGDPGMMDILRANPLPLGPGTIAGVAGLERRAIHWHDVLEVKGYARREAQRLGGYRTILGVPMLKGDALLGVIVLWKTRVEPFTEKQIELVSTFADQAVIAIENVRLLSELRDRTAALDRSVQELRALGEVGQAVASSLDLETVLRTIVTRATELTGTNGGSIWEYDEAEELFHLHATHHQADEVAEALRATPIRKGEGVIGRLAATARPVVVRDIRDEGAYQSRVRDVLVRHGFRALVAVPLLRDRRLLGGLTVNRDTPGDFSPEVVALLETFATQSAVAIQNARLFRELERKGRELESASRHKSEFLANMSHELRTPLNAILGFSELLSERIFGEINEKQAEYLKDIQESGRHLLALINDILDLSKIEAGRMELELSDFDLPTAIGNTLILVRERAERRGVALRSAIDPSLGAFRADERKLKQVLLNLLSNALKFTPEGGRVDVAARALDGGAEISVTDTGVGIAPEDQQSVFEEFRQVGAAARKVEGTGLGLAISRKFVELHGGRLGVESTLGKGSTFTFTLPSQPPPGARAETL